MTKFYLKVLAFLPVAYAVSAVNVAKAACQPGVTPCPSEVPLTDVNQVFVLVSKVVDYAFVFFFALAAFFFLWAAFDYLTSAGSDDKLKSAKDRLIYALIGVAVALVAKSLPTFVQNFIK